MGISLPENSLRRHACAHAVQLAEHIDNEDIEYVACSILPLRTGTRMKLLRHLLIDTKTTYLVGDGQAHFRHTFNGWRHQVYLACFARTEMHFNGLPCPCFVFHSNFDQDSKLKGAEKLAPFFTVRVFGQNVRFFTEAARTSSQLSFLPLCS
jgi:hypothetical protein